MRNLFLLILCTIYLQVNAQDISGYDKPPVFPECETEDIEDLKACFIQKVSQFVFVNFKVPQIVKDENYNGDIVVLFEVDADGNFIVLYVGAIYEALKEETRRVFGELPKIRPSTYNGKPTYKQYSFQVKIPLTDPATNTLQEAVNTIRK